MIQQAELKAAHALAAEAKRLEADPAVSAYLAAKKAEEKILSGLRQRVSRGEAVKDGRFAVVWKASYSVGWEKVVGMLRDRPAVAEAILGDAGAKRILVQANGKDPAAAFVTSRITLSVVVAE